MDEKLRLLYDLDARITESRLRFIHMKEHGYDEIPSQLAIKLTEKWLNILREIIIMEDSNDKDKC